MSKDEYIIGRKGNLKLEHQSVSREHARLRVDNGRFHIMDLGSANGIYRVTGGNRLRFRDGYVQMDEKLAFGEYVCTVRQLLAMQDTGANANVNRLGPGESALTDAPGQRKRCIHCGQVVLAHVELCEYCGQSCS